MQILKFKKIFEEATVPRKANATDSGFDLFAIGFTEIEPYGTAIVPTGIAIELPSGYEAQVRPRSGVSSRTSLQVILGTIDQGYTGEIGIIVRNHSNNAIVVPKGYKLAQLVPQKREDIVLEEVTDFSQSTERGSKGFGSSGVA